MNYTKTRQGGKKNMNRKHSPASNVPETLKGLLILLDWQKQIIQTLIADCNNKPTVRPEDKGRNPRRQRRQDG